MRLTDFILCNIEPILAEWEDFARSLWPGKETDPRELRDHAADILRATAADMKSTQSPKERFSKSKGESHVETDGDAIDVASAVHALGRVRSGFDLQMLVAEYRALRASVIRLWRDSGPDSDHSDLEELTRFNESIDQSLTEAVHSYTGHVDRSRHMFLAILGHDLRNPLNSVMMSAGVLSRIGKLTPQASAMVDGISTSATAMAKMIGDLLDFTGAGLGGVMPTSPAPMDLKQLCSEVIGEMRAAYPQRTIRYESVGDLAGHWDAARLRQLVSNLMGNAIQHGGDTSPIDLKASAQGAGIQMTVHNSGPPIPGNLLPTIFDPLVRDQSPELQKQRRPGSIGLGLYIAREVVTAHGGSIDVKSSKEEGTLFTVRLPRKGAAAHAAHAAGFPAS